MDKDQNITHKEYLHTDKSDPRLPLAKSLIDTLQDTGTIVAYNAGFEKGVMSRLAQWYPEYAESLQSIIDRLLDQLNIFRNFYIDYGFRGSNSLKDVLPIIVRSMSYDNLAVSDGTEAQVTWNEMIQLKNGDEKSEIA